ncbi:MAG: Yip1 family protein [Calditrichaceae bacterium]
MNIIERVKRILMTPATEWEIIKAEQASVSGLFSNYAVILAAIPAAAGFIGFSFFGISSGYGSFKFSIGTTLTWAVVSYIMSLIGVFVVGYVIDFLAPNFGSTKDLVSSMKVAVYAYTAAWVGGIFNLIPSLAIVSALAGIYSLVLLYKGIESIKMPPANKLVSYFVVTLLIAIVIFFITGALLSPILMKGNVMYGTL